RIAFRPPLGDAPRPVPSTWHRPPEHHIVASHCFARSCSCEPPHENDPGVGREGVVHRHERATAARAHQISLINQVALQSCAVPIPYQVFYLLHDASRYLPLVVVNAVFMACCIATLFMNRAGKHAAARNTMFTALHVQLLVVTYFLGNGAGVHLLYFPLGTWLGLFFASRRLHAILAFTLAALLFVVCHYAFPPEAASIAAPAALLHVTFIGSAVSALCIAGALSYQFRL